MSPYIVTTRRHWADAASNTAGTQVESRRAVATLEEARNRINNLHGPSLDLMREVAALSESGGTVGPLPDETTIQVERVTPRDRRLWEALPDIVRARYGSRANISPADLLDAFNARQSENQNERSGNDGD